MDFTRQPIVETIITAKEGCKLVVRSSKGAGQEEYFVEAVEVVSFGHSFFFRSMEKPKSFLVPATDYEIVEVREARMVLKHVGSDRAIKIAGGNKSPPQKQVKVQQKTETKETKEIKETEEGKEQTQPSKGEEKRRERRRSSRRRRGRSEDRDDSVEGSSEEREDGEAPEASPEKKPRGRRAAPGEQVPAELSSSLLKTLLPPPSTLISDTIEKYKDNALFKDAFFDKSQVIEERAQEEVNETESGFVLEDKPQREQLDTIDASPSDEGHDAEESESSYSSNQPN